MSTHPPTDISDPLRVRKLEAEVGALKQILEQMVLVVDAQGKNLSTAIYQINQLVDLTNRLAALTLGPR